MGRKYNIDVSLRDDEANYLNIIAYKDTEAGDEDEALDNLLDRIRDNAEVTKEGGSYHVGVTAIVSVSFDFEDEEGEYADTDEVEAAFENGDICFDTQVSRDQWALDEVDRVTVEEL